MRGWVGEVGLAVEMDDSPVTTIEEVRLMAGSAVLAGILMAVAPASVYWLPT